MLHVHMHTCVCVCVCVWHEAFSYTNPEACIILVLANKKETNFMAFVGEKAKQLCAVTLC